MEVIDDCTVFFLGILPHTLPTTGKSSSPTSPFPLEQAQDSSPPPKKTGCTLVFRVEFEYYTPVLELSLSTMIPCTQTQLMTNLRCTQLNSL